MGQTSPDHVTEVVRPAAPVLREKNSSGRRPDPFAATWLLAPILILLSTLYLYPLARIVYLSVGGKEVTLSGYADFFTTAPYVRILVFTVVMSVVATLLTIMIAYPLAYALAVTRAGIRGILLTAILTTWLIPDLVRNFAWVVVIQPNGVLARAQEAIGLGSQPLIQRGTTAAVLLGIITVQLPLAVLPIYAVMRRVDFTLLSVAYSLGARPVQMLRHILIPLTMPGVTTSLILILLTTLGFYVTPLILGGGSRIFLAGLIGIHISLTLNWTLASAMSVVLVLVGLGILTVASRFVGWRWLVER